MPRAQVGISENSPFAQEAWANKENIKVALLSNYDHSIAKGV
jgi:peroxiredoxin